jgi:hypothetical protein
MRISRSGISAQLGCPGAGLGLRLRQAGGGVQLERALGADAAVGGHVAPGRHGGGVAQLPALLVALQAQADIVDVRFRALVHEGGAVQARIVDRDREGRRQLGRHRRALLGFLEGLDAQVGRMQLVHQDAARDDLRGRPVQVDLVGDDQLLVGAPDHALDVHGAVQGPAHAGERQLAAGGGRDLLRDHLQRGFAAQVPERAADQDASHGHADGDAARPAALVRCGGGCLARRGVVRVHQKVNPKEKCRRAFFTA